MTFGEIAASGDLIYRLPDCGHSFALSGIDMWLFRPNDSGQGKREIHLKYCPYCRTVIRSAPRYGNITKPLNAQLEKIKAVLRKTERQITEDEIRGVVRVLAEGGQNMGPGHWFVCPRGHPYVIADCGGAMEESACPECGARIGGAQHALTQGNAFASSTFNGSAPPTWPTMGR